MSSFFFEKTRQALWKENVRRRPQKLRFLQRMKRDGQNGIFSGRADFFFAV